MTTIGVYDVQFRLGKREKTLIADHRTSKIFVMHQGRKQYLQMRHGKWWPVRESSASRRRVRKR